MIKDLVRTLSFGHVQDIKVVKEEIKGREIHYKIEGYVRPAEIKNVLSKEINKTKKQPEFEAVMENRYIKILSIKDNLRLKGKWDEGNIERIEIAYRQKKRGGPFYEASFYGRWSESSSWSVIVVDWFDKNGDPIYSQEVNTESGVYAGFFKRELIEAPNGAKSYRLWFLEEGPPK